MENNFDQKQPVLIKSSNCEWCQSQLILTIRQDDWEGIIPPNEFEVRTEKMLSSSSTPASIISLLSNEYFKVKFVCEDGGKYIFSRKAYLEDCKREIQIDKVYPAEIMSICSWGIFCKINDATVLVHKTEFSACHFFNLSNIVHVGEYITVKIISKVTDENGSTFINGSRKAICSTEPPHQVGDIVSVIIGRPIVDGYHCEVTPYRSGIIDVPQSARNYLEGERLLGRIKRINDLGYKLSSF